MERSTTATPPSPLSTTASPTTYVQADASSFRDLVQRLTGANPSDVVSPSRPCSTSSSSVAPRRNAFKLHDRRAPTVRNLEIHFGLTSLRSPGRSAVPSKSPTIPSPVTPLVSGSLFSPAPAEEETAAIAERGFYLHPSPRGSSPPELLHLFPLCSPKQQQQVESAKIEERE